MFFQSSLSSQMSALMPQPSEQFFLNDELLNDGYILTCAAYPTADITVETFSSDEVNARF